MVLLVLSCFIRVSGLDNLYFGQERFYFGDTVLPLFQTGIPLLRKRLAILPDNDNITIAYPDEGAWKRFHYQFGDYPEVGTPDPYKLRPEVC